MTANAREEIIRLWFSMWLQKRDLGMERVFAPDAVYLESWGPEYCGLAKIKWWFEEWNTRGTVLQWDVKQFFHKENQTVVQWYFKNQMKNGAIEAFDGMTLVVWNGEGKIHFLQEFGCNTNRYDPYAGGSKPVFRQEPAKWF